MRSQIWKHMLRYSALLCVLGPAAAQGDAITQSASIPLTPTDFTVGNPYLGGSDPLSFTRFNTEGGTRTLDAVVISLHATTHNEYTMTFVNPTTISASVAALDPTSKAPTVTIDEPGGTTPALVLTASNDPSALTRTVTYGSQPGQSFPQTFSSKLDPTSPFYLAPTDSSASSSATLTAAADLAKFTGTGSVSLPVSASAVAKITIGSGNGSGGVTTSGSADVTVTYEYHDTALQVIPSPEPATLFAWGAAAAGLLALGRLRRGTARG